MTSPYDPVFLAYITLNGPSIIALPLRPPRLAPSGGASCHSDNNGSGEIKDSRAMGRDVGYSGVCGGPYLGLHTAPSLGDDATILNPDFGYNLLGLAKLSTPAHTH